MREANTIAHSRTTMDSGAFPGDGYPRAAYHRNIQYAEPGGGRYVDAAPSDLAQNRDAEHPLCYNITVQQPAVNFTNWPGGTTTTKYPPGVNLDKARALQIITSGLVVIVTCPNNKQMRSKSPIIGMQTRESLPTDFDGAKVETIAIAGSIHQPHLRKAKYV
jgi:hypothetical protein